MTSLDFQSLLRQEKARLRQAERATPSTTSATRTSADNNAAQPKAKSLTIRHQQRDQDCKVGVVGGGEAVSDGVLKSNEDSSGHALSISPSDSLAEDCGPEEQEVDSEDCPLRRGELRCFAELAGRPSLDPAKVYPQFLLTRVLLIDVLPYQSALQAVR